MLTIAIAKILGLYLITVGLALVLKRKEIMLAVVALTKERAARLMGALVALVFGLILVTIHNDWSTLPAVLVSLFGWGALIKGLAFLFFKDSATDKFVDFFLNRSWYFIEGVLIMLIGAYLANYGFGWF